MRGRRSRRLPAGKALTAVLAGVALLAVAGCSGSSPQPTPPASPGLLNGVVTMAAERPLGPGEQQQVTTVLRARLAALNIDSLITIVGNRIVRLQVPGPTVNVVRQLGAQGRFEIRPVETLGPKGSPPPGAVPAAVARSAGRCAISGPGDTQGWLVACDPAQRVSYLLWPAQLTNADVASAGEVANLSQQSEGEWFVNVSFTASGQRRFYQLTERSLGMQIGLVVDGVVESAPVVETAIDGDAQITAVMNHAQARLLATLIGNGVLPVVLRPQAG